MTLPLLGFHVSPNGNISIRKSLIALSASCDKPSPGASRRPLPEGEGAVFRVRTIYNRIRTMKRLASLLLMSASMLAAGGQQPGGLGTEVDRRVHEIESKAISWRRDIHQNPELSNREVRTSALVADHLRKLGIEVRTEIAHTGVIGVLRGRQPGPVVAL